MSHAFSDTAADQAAEWLTTLMSSDFSAADQQRWQQWRAADPDNERAWQHIEAVCARLKGLQGGPAYQVLSVQSPRRRNSIALLLGLGVAGSAGVLGARSQAWQQLSADMRTAVGERREWTLEDGTRVLLNTGSAVKLRYDAHQRLLQLVTGEIRIETSHAGAAGRPFIVQTAQGRVRALGTVFSVRQLNHRTQVDVQNSAVEITPASADSTPLTLTAGQRTVFSTRDITAPTPSSTDNLAWTLGAIVADDMRLDDFLEELGRYRRGVLRCDPALAKLRFSGVFPLKDTNAVLAMLPNSLPVRIRTFSPYWVSVEKR
ncbi:FecR domain-containing protein [Duganella sp. sic0402]|uniref:FecR domain-containing protein n=1 Tax=Duganella sp. sic0402 TaxID=2854786 RepID=UPI001C481D77|nr:FecR domain-containing protein [Duganella sp. sic0402]MBV7534253.1 FecR domain-containing protein [Duganella sp. sic0402]